MQHSHLMSHVDTDLVTRDQLRLVPVPEPTRTWRPIPHIDLVESLEQVLQQNQITIQGEQFALRRDGSTLFGVLQLVYESTSDGRAAMGIRTSNNKTMSIQICAGLCVFVCDNLVFRGDLIALNRKHTSGLVLRTELSNAVLRFQEHFGRLTTEIDVLKRQELTDTQAKAIIHDVFARGVFPIRLFREVSQAYFGPLAEGAGCTRWILHNAFTVVAKEMPITTRMPAIQELGRYFGMSNEASAAA